MYRLIAFTGKAGSGKSTAAKYLVDSYGYTRIRFADGLKRMLIEGLGVDPRYVDGDLKEAVCPELCGRTARHAMVTLGTEWGRELIHPNIWVRALDTQMYKLISQGRTKFVIDDCRFLNEADFVRRFSAGGTIRSRIIRVVRPDTDMGSHKSETEMDKIESDYILCNGTTIESMKLTLDSMLNMINV